MRNVKSLSSKEVAEEASGDNAASTRFAINSALLTLPELSDCSWGSVERSLEAISLHDRHSILVSGGASGLFSQVVQKERELQQAELKAVFAEATDELMTALAPHLAEYGVTINDTLPDLLQAMLRRSRATMLEQPKLQALALSHRKRRLL